MQLSRPPGQAAPAGALHPIAPWVPGSRGRAEPVNPTSGRALSGGHRSSQIQPLGALVTQHCQGPNARHVPLRPGSQPPVPTAAGGPAEGASQPPPLGAQHPASHEGPRSPLPVTPSRWGQFPGHGPWGRCTAADGCPGPSAPPSQAGECLVTLELQAPGTRLLLSPQATPSAPGLEVPPVSGAC